MEMLEKAADLLMASPDLVSREQRQEAEQVFMQLRQTKSPFNLCREILESSSAPYLLFEAASLLRVGIIREWRDLSADDRVQLRHYIIQYVLARPLQPHYVRETLVQVVAIMIKRGSVEDHGEERGQLLNEVEQLIQSGDSAMRLIGCSILSALMQEYAVTVKSTDVGVTWETHFWAKKDFEKSDLRRIFHFVVQLLKEGLEGVGGGQLPQGDLRQLLLKLLVLAERTLTWTFISLHLPKRLMSVFEQDQNPSLRPGKQWEETFRDAALIELFFKAYWSTRGDWDLGYHALNCLVQLASLNGVALINKQARIAYLSHYLTCFFSLLSNVEVMECEALGLSHVFRKLLQFFPPSILAALPCEMLSSLVDHLTTLACQYAQHAANEEHVDQENQVYMEAFEQILQSWNNILQEASCTVPATSFVITSGGLATHLNSSPSAAVPATQDVNNMLSLRPQIKESATLIFDTYIKCHLAPPHGSRKQPSAAEITDSVLSDRVLYKDQLTLVGISAIQNPEHCVGLLTQLLEERTTLLRAHLSSCLQTSARHDQQAIDNLYEDLHWLVLVICHVVTTDYGHDSSLIPSELVEYSVSCAPHTDLPTTLALLAAPQTMPADMAADSTKADPLIRLLSAVMRVCETESQALKANMRDLLSPELSCTLLWFLKRFCVSYLMPPEVCYKELSIALSSAFGKDSEGAEWVLGFLLNSVWISLRLRASEPALLEDTISLLVTMMENKARCEIIIKSPSLREIVSLQRSGELASISSSASRGIMQGLVLLAGSVPSDNPYRQELWQHVIDPLIVDLRTLVTRDDFTNNYDTDSYRKQVLHQLDNLIGAVQGCILPTASLLFERLVPALTATARLLDLYHNYPEMVEGALEVHVECAKRLLCYLTAADSKQLYEGSVEIIRVYAKHNIGRRTAKSEGDDQWRDVHLLMELLTSLLSKDIIDLSPCRGDDDQTEVVVAADVCLYGLNIIMPLMTHELLQIPALCQQYYKMVTFIAEIFPLKIVELPVDLMQNLVRSIELGITSFGPEASAYSFDFLFVLTTFVFKHNGPDTEIRKALQPFLKLVLDQILSQQINSDLLQAASASLYILICCFQTEYRTLVGQLLATQQDPTTNQRLAQAFTQLTEDVELTAERTHKFKFRSNFEEFIANVRGFLFVK